jgi:limonene-1,2-epoxide hydrolase
VTSHAALVRDFIAAWGRADLDAIMAFLTEDCVYHNMPLDPVRGTAAIRGVLQGFAGMASEIDWVLLALAETETGVVLTERTDRFLIAGSWVELPVMGAFEIRDGRIAAWRDYFDLAQFQKQLPQAT